MFRARVLIGQFDEIGGRLGALGSNPSLGSRSLRGSRTGHDKSALRLMHVVVENGPSQPETH
jgi:hypothetical protein